MPYIFVVPYCPLIYKEGEDVRGEAVFGVSKLTLFENYHYFVSVIPASTLVVIDDNTLLRRILCHEFSHCFFFTIEAVRQMREGRHCFGIGSPSMKDKELLANPADWFGSWDIENFLVEIETDPSWDILTDTLERKWIQKGLPKEKDTKFRGGAINLVIPPDVRNHVNLLDGISKQ